MNQEANQRPTPHLVLGGARSGKSAYAEHMMSTYAPRYLYIATAQVLDEEMRERVRQHRERRQSVWDTLESPVEIAQVLDNLKTRQQPVLLDCLTLWLTNLLIHSQASPEQEVHHLCAVLRTIDYPLIMVSNEVGYGIVPENALARRFRDLAGWTNQQVAKTCRSVTLVVAGLPVRIK